MEWLEPIAKLGLTGTSALLAYATLTLWKALQAKETKHESVVSAKDAKYEAMVAAKDAKIETLNTRMLEMLIDVSKLSDED